LKQQDYKEDYVLTAQGILTPPGRRSRRLQLHNVEKLKEKCVKNVNSSKNVSKYYQTKNKMIDIQNFGFPLP